MRTEQVFIRFSRRVPAVPAVVEIDCKDFDSEARPANLRGRLLTGGFDKGATLCRSQKIVSAIDSNS
jgi:hypothetical protein